MRCTYLASTDNTDPTGHAEILALYLPRAHRQHRKIFGACGCVQTVSGSGCLSMNAQHTSTAALYGQRNSRCTATVNLSLGGVWAGTLLTPTRHGNTGTNEHHNARIRRYLPTRTDFRTVTDKELQEITTEINNQPRKYLGQATPAETYQHHTPPQCCTSDLNTGVGSRNYRDGRLKLTLGPWRSW